MRPTPLFIGGTLLSILLAGSALAQSANGPVETRRAHGSDQTPAFEGQTRASQPAEMPKIAAQVVAQDLPHLWSVEFLPDV